MDYFSFLEQLKIGDEVLVSSLGDKIIKVTGVNDKHIATDCNLLFEKATGLQIEKKKSIKTPMLLELTDSEKKQFFNVRKKLLSKKS